MVAYGIFLKRPCNTLLDSQPDAASSVAMETIFYQRCPGEFERGSGHEHRKESTAWNRRELRRGCWGAGCRHAGEGKAGAVRVDLQTVRGRLLLHTLLRR